MKLEVTAKDIRLIKWVVSILILALTLSLFVWPGIGRIQESGSILGDARLQKAQMEEEIDNINALEFYIQQQREELEELASPYYGNLENHQVDELVTGIILDHDLFPVALSIRESGMGAAAPYPFLSHGAQASSGGSGVQSGSEAGSGSQSGSEAGRGDNSGALRQIAAELSVQGREADIHAFLDDIERNYPAIQIRSFQMERGTYVDGSMELVERMSMSCQLAIYSCQELEGQQEKEAVGDGGES